MENITIPMEEYKELLIIKGKYEELKSQQVKPILVREPRTMKDYELPKEPYMVTCYEHIVISAVRYALGRMTYIVEITVNYIMQQIKDDKLSYECLKIIKRDIEEELKINGMFDSDRRQWVRLKTKIEEVI